MPSPRDAFISFLHSSGIPDLPAVVARFDRYLELLADINARVNLVSRATPIQDYWNKHFLDSLMLLKCVGLTGAKVLDFGSGGGFPGVPLLLAGVDCRMTLLDSIAKKAAALNQIIQELGLSACGVVCSRLEDHNPPAKGRYDVILCRAVKMEQRFAAPLAWMLQPGGRVIFYKSATHDDLDGYSPTVLLDTETDWGRRMLLSVPRERLKQG